MSVSYSLSTLCVYDNIILEAIAYQSSWFWHAHFGFHRKNNDLNVLDHSPFVVNFLQGDESNVRFMVNIGNEYVQYYLLVDGIYPYWFIFVQTIHEPQWEM